MAAELQSESVLERAWRASAALLERLPVATWISDSEGRVVRANASARRLLTGADDGADDLPQPLRWLRSGADDPSPLAELAHGGSVRERALVIERADGARIEVEVDVEPLHAEDGRLAGGLWCARPTAPRPPMPSGPSEPSEPSRPIAAGASEREQPPASPGSPVSNGPNVSNSPARAGLERLAPEREPLERLAPERVGRIQARHTALVAATNAIVLATDAQGSLCEPEPAWEKYTGQDWPAYAGTGWTQAIHPDDRGTTRAAWERALAARAPDEARGRAWHAPTATWRAFVLRIAPVVERDGAVREWIATHTDVDDEKHAEQRIADSETRHRAIFELAVHGLLTLDEHGAIESINRAGERLFGYAREEIVGSSVDRLMPARLSVRSAHAAGAGQACELEGIRKDGTRFDVELVESELDIAGRKRTHCLVQDVSERKRAERAVRESEARLRELADAMPQFVWTARPDGHLDSYNLRWHEYTGLSVEQSTRPEGWRSVVHPDDVAACIETWYTAVEKGEPYTLELRFRDARSGTYRWHLSRALPVRDEHGRIVRWLGTSTDIDEQKRTEHRLRESEQQYRLIGEAIPCGVWMANAEGRAAYVSPSFLDLIGITLDEVREHGLARRLPPQDVDAALAGWRHCIATGENWEAEHRLLGADGKYHVVLSRGHAIRDGEGRVTSWVGIHLDISERKHLEVELEDAKNAAERASLAKDHFLAVLSHELRTPLTPVLMIASTLESRRDLPQAVLDELGILRRNVELEARLIDDLLDLTRITRGKLELNLNAVDLGVLLQETARICSAELDAKAVRLELDVEPGLRPIEADAARLQQTFWNLIKNAIKFTPAGGHVWVRAHEDPAGDGVAIVVEDDGIGIEPEAMAKIFDAFEQGDPAVTKAFGGLGLGLAISKALVEFHGGTIRAQSAGRGRGARFTVHLPSRLSTQVARQPQRDAGDSRAQPSAATGVARKDTVGRGLAILCVEDHADTARLMGQLLQSRGHVVRIAGTLGAAISAFERERFDLLLSDIGLPDGSGLDLIRNLRTVQPDLVGIALTGYGTDEDVQACLDAGFAQHLTKPINMRELEGAIVRLTSRAE